MPDRELEEARRIAKRLVNKIGPAGIGNLRFWTWKTSFYDDSNDDAR